MILRFLFALFFALGLSSQALACSCSPWSGYVSEFTEDYISVWAVPTKADVNIDNLGKPSGGITYKLHILEGFDRIIQTDINVDSNVANGGSCGVQPTLGVPQFISAHKYTAGEYNLSTCTPSMPYNAVKLYLRTGEDTYIPEWGKCFSWPEDATDYTPPTFNEEREECSVWKGVYYNSPSYDHEAGDQTKYRKIWWDKIKSAESKKKRRWWSFNKD